jgi:hypothetical protein
MRIVLAGERNTSCLAASLEIIRLPLGERWTQKSHGIRILRPSNDVNLPCKRCHASPTGAVQMLKTDHSNANSNSTPARTCAIRLQRHIQTDSGMLDASSWGPDCEFMAIPRAGGAQNVLHRALAHQARMEYIIRVRPIVGSRRGCRNPLVFKGEEDDTTAEQNRLKKASHHLPLIGISVVSCLR